MSVALRGELGDFGIAEVFQLVGQQRKTGLLKIRNGRKRAVIAFDRGVVAWGHGPSSTEHVAVVGQLVREGQIPREPAAACLEESRVAARSLFELVVSAGLVTERDFSDARGRLTRNTLFDLLQWQEGRFDFIAEAAGSYPVCEHPVHPEQFLMDGIRKVDEWNASKEWLFDPSSVLQPTGFESLPVGQEDLLSGVAQKVLASLDGRRTVEAAIDRARIDFFDGMLGLVDLARAGRVEHVPARSFSRVRAKAIPVSLHTAFGALPAVGPLLLLAAVVALMLLTPVRSEQDGGLSEMSIENVRTLFESVQRRNREAFRRFELDPAKGRTLLSKSTSAIDRRALAAERAGIYTAGDRD